MLIKIPLFLAGLFRKVVIGITVHSPERLRYGKN